MVVLALICVAGLAIPGSASPLGGSGGGSGGPGYPGRATSKGFRLVVNATDPSRDFAPSMQGGYITSIHAGAGQSLVGVDVGPAPARARARVFYQNGTTLEIRRSQSTVVSDGGLPLSPFGLSLSTDGGSTGLSTAHLDAGPGTRGIGTTRPPVPYAFLYPDVYFVCNESLPYYAGAHFLILKRARAAAAGGRCSEQCAPVRLLPECAPLNDLPPGSYASHEYAADSACYQDVAAIDWKEYPPLAYCPHVEGRVGKE